MQVLIEALLRRQLSTVGEVVIELVAFEHLICVLVLCVRVFPLHVKEMAAMAGILHPASSEGRPFEPLILGSERQHKSA